MFTHLGVRKSTVATIILLLLCHLPVISAFHFRRNVNFAYCWNSTVQFLNTTDYDDERQYFPWDRTHSYRLNLSRPFLSLYGCESLCNDGYELWPADDTLLRVFMWVLPACVLLVHFHFAPLGLSNKFAVITHLLGDPLDTLWSMMTRQEVNRRLYRRANRYRELATDFKHVATIWSTYDELGWGNPSRWFAEALQNRNPNRRNGAPAPRTQNINPNRRKGAAAPRKQNITRQSTGQLFRRLDFLETARTWGRNLEEEHELQEIDVHGLSEAELYYIQLASHRLACNRSESQLTTWFAIVGLLGALCAAFIRTYTQQLNNQTSHTIAVVTLFFVLIPIIKISGNIGSFTSTSIAMDIIQELQRNLDNLNPRHPLFPPVQFDSDNFPWDYSQDPKSAQAKGQSQPLPGSATRRANSSDRETSSPQKNSSFERIPNPSGSPSSHEKPNPVGASNPQKNPISQEIPVQFDFDNFPWDYWQPKPAQTKGQSQPLPGSATRRANSSDRETSSPQRNSSLQRIPNPPDSSSSHEKPNPVGASNSQRNPNSQEDPSFQENPNSQGNPGAQEDLNSQENPSSHRDSSSQGNPSSLGNPNSQRNPSSQGNSRPSRSPNSQRNPSSQEASSPQINPNSQGNASPERTSSPHEDSSPPGDPDSGTPDSTGASGSSPTSEYMNLKMWPKMAPWAGMNNSWRPCKQMMVLDHPSTEDRDPITLFIISLLFVLCAYFPALILSYRTPTVGFGCRSMAWTFVLFIWLCSVAFDLLFKFYIPLAQQLWTWTLVKDSIIVFFFVGTIVSAQIGLFNSCWCQSTVLQLHADAHLRLGPQSPEDWNAGWPLWISTPLAFLVLIGGLIVMVGQDGENARTLLSRDESERQSDLLLLTKARSKLKKDQL